MDYNSTGYDLLTGEKLGFWDRAISGVTAVIPGGGALKAGLAAGAAAAIAIKASKVAKKTCNCFPEGHPS